MYLSDRFLFGLLIAILATFAISTFFGEGIFVGPRGDQTPHRRVREKVFRGSIVERGELVFAIHQNSIVDAERASLQKRPVVVSVETNKSGDLVEISFLEMPLPFLGDALREKMSDWRISYSDPELPGEHFRVRSKLTFYVVVDSQSVMLADPTDFIFMTASN